MNAKYDVAREAFATADLSWMRDRIVLQLVSREYKFSAAHRAVGELTGLVGRWVELADKTVAGGWLSAKNVVFREVSGPEVVAIVVRRQALEASRNTLIAYLDEIERFPVTLNGGDIELEIPQPGLLRL